MTFLGPGDARLPRLLQAATRAAALTSSSFCKSAAPSFTYCALISFLVVSSLLLSGVVQTASVWRTMYVADLVGIAMAGNGSNMTAFVSRRTGGGLCRAARHDDGQ